MAEFSYDLNVTLEPPSGSLGTTVKATAKFSNVVGEIKSVYAMVNAYGYSEFLPKASENTYSTTIVVPYGAPPGTYDVTFFARDTQGNRGKGVTVQFTVT